MSEQIPKAFRDAFPPEPSIFVTDREGRVVGVDLPPTYRVFEADGRRIPNLQEQGGAGWWDDHPYLAGALGTAAFYAAVGLIVVAAIAGRCSAP